MIDRIPAEYKKRRSIETGYRVTGMARPRTCSRNPAVRLFMSCMSMIMYNLWSITNAMASDNPGRAGPKRIIMDEMLVHYSASAGRIGRIDPKRSHYLEAVS